EELLYAQLEGRTEHCDAVLDAMARRAEPLTRPDAVLRLAQDASAPLPTRGRALRCLEATGAEAQALVLERSRLRHPVLDYGTARLLRLARRPSGIELLLDVVQAPDDAADETEAVLVQEARLGARQILAALADTSRDAEVAEWTEWAARGPALQFEG